MSIDKKLDSITEAPITEAGKLLNQYNNLIKKFRSEFLDKATLKHMSENVKFMGMAIDDIQEWASSKEITNYKDPDIAEEGYADSQMHLEMLVEEVSSWALKLKRGHVRLMNSTDKIVKKIIDAKESE